VDFTRSVPTVTSSAIVNITTIDVKKTWAIVQRNVREDTQDRHASIVSVVFLIYFDMLLLHVHTITI